MSLTIFQLIDRHPSIAGFIIIVILLLYREEILDIIYIRILKKERPNKRISDNISPDQVKNMEVFCDDVKSVFVFKSHVVVPSYEMLYNSLLNMIARNRYYGYKIIIDMSMVDSINDITKEAIRDAIFDAITKNNVRIMIIFPRDDLMTTEEYQSINRLYKELLEKIETKGTSSVTLKICGRACRIRKCDNMPLIDHSIKNQGNE